MSPSLMHAAPHNVTGETGNKQREKNMRRKKYPPRIEQAKRQKHKYDSNYTIFYHNRRRKKQ